MGRLGIWVPSMRVIRRSLSQIHVRRHFRLSYVFFGIAILLVLLSFLRLKLTEESYESLNAFEYPPNVDLDLIIDRVSRGQPLSSRLPRPSNPRIFRFLLGDLDVCRREGVQLLVLVKSAAERWDKRDAIRRSWGNASCYRPKKARVLFLLGLSRKPHATFSAGGVVAEQRRYGDLVQQDFIDSYYNNTHKMMMGFQLKAQHCPNASFLVLVDDDYILSPSSLTRYVAGVHPRLMGHFLAGYVWYASQPARKPSSKWYLSRKAYRFLHFPNYAEAGTLMVSGPFAHDLYIAMQWTKYLAFDDIFLGFILHKLHVAPAHCRLVFHRRPTGHLPVDFISVHGFDTPLELLNAWKESGLAERCLHGGLRTTPSIVK